jgi:transcriptional regulator with XRE-family HTH domain
MAGLSLDELAGKSGLSRNALSRLERDKTRRANLPWVLGRILPFLAGHFKKAFPKSNGDPYDFLIPPTTFGGWLKNFRMRHGLKLTDLARALKVRPFSVIRYESDRTKPAPGVRRNLRQAYGINGEVDRFFFPQALRKVTI